MLGAEQEESNNVGLIPRVTPAGFRALAALPPMGMRALRLQRMRLTSAGLSAFLPSLCGLTALAAQQFAKAHGIASAMGHAAASLTAPGGGLTALDLSHCAEIDDTALELLGRCVGEARRDVRPQLIWVRNDSSGGSAANNTNGVPKVTQRMQTAGSTLPVVTCSTSAMSSASIQRRLPAVVASVARLETTVGRLACLSRRLRDASRRRERR